MTVTLGIDIGGTKIAAGLVDERGGLSRRTVVPTGAPDGRDAVLERVVALARAVIAGAPEPPVAVGVASAGLVDRISGVVVSATDLLPGWGGVALRGHLETALGLPVEVDNDVNAMALAELELGAARGERDALCVAVGTGVGGAVIVDGRFVRGARGLAGHVGHVVLMAGGRRCTCGARGCVEAYVSGPAIAREFARRAGRHRLREWLDVRPSEVTIQHVVRCLGSGPNESTRLADQTISRAGRLLGHVLGGLANLLDPGVIVIGGGVTAGLGDRFVSAVQAGLVETALPAIRGVRVAPADLGADAGLVGAGLLAMTRG